MYKEKFLFYSLLRYDHEGRLDSACSSLAELPSQLLRRPRGSSGTARQLRSAAPTSCPQHEDGTAGSCDQQADPSFAALRDALLGLAKQQELLVSERGQASTYCDVGTYVGEADVMAAQAKRPASLKFLGRALEASAILYAMKQLVRQYDASCEPSGTYSAGKLRDLVAQHPELVSGFEADMRCYGRLYDRHVTQVCSWIKGLAALRRASPDTYRVFGSVMMQQRGCKAALDRSRDADADIAWRYKQVWLKRTSST